MNSNCVRHCGWMRLGFLAAGIVLNGSAAVFGQAPISQNPGAPQPDANGNVRVPLMTAQQAVEQGVAQVPQQPFPALSVIEQQRLDQILNVWEQRTAAIERYQCKFNRWQYDPTKYTDSFFSKATGQIKFMAPDKGMFQVDTLETIAQKGPPPVYRVNPREPHGEFWICDGQWIYIRDRNAKKETRIELPPAMRGKGIPNSPLPFLFGVKAAELKSRYWMREITQMAKPEQQKTSVFLEAWPKRADDAGNYSRVQVILDRSDVLPSALIVFMPNWTNNAQHKEIYEFTDREIPGRALLPFLQKAFLPTDLPSDWQIIKEPFVPPQQANVAQQPAAAQNR